MRLGNLLHRQKDMEDNLNTWYRENSTSLQDRRNGMLGNESILSKNKIM